MKLRMQMLLGAVLLLTVVSVQSAIKQNHHQRVPPLNTRNKVKFPSSLPKPPNNPSFKNIRGSQVYKPVPGNPPFSPPPVKPPFNPPPVNPPFNPHPVNPPFNPPPVNPPFNPHPVNPPFNPHPVNPPFNPHPVNPPFNPHPVNPPFNPPPVNPPFNPHPVNPHFPTVNPNLPQPINPNFPQPINPNFPQPINPAPLPKPIHPPSPPSPPSPPPQPPPTACNICAVAETGFANQVQNISEIDEILQEIFDLSETCTSLGSVEAVIRIGPDVTCPTGSRVISCRCADEDVCTGIVIGTDVSCSAGPGSEEVIAICAYDFNNKYSIERPLVSTPDTVGCPASAKMTNCYARTDVAVAVLIENNECTVLGSCTPPDGCDLTAVCKLD